MRNHRTGVSHRRGEQGFTLIEALIAMVILIVGIAAISNLMVVAGTSNTVANSTTAASSVASQQMELLKAARYNMLAAGGTMVMPPTHTTSHPQCNTGVVTAVYACDTNVPGVGSIHVQWEIVGPLAGAVPAGTVFINLMAQPIAPGIGMRARARFTTFRTDLG